MKRLVLFFLAVVFCFLIIPPIFSAPLILHSQVVSGDRGVYLGSFVFATDIEGVRIEALRFYNAEVGSDAAVENLELWHEDTRLGTSPLVSRYADFNNFEFIIPRNGKETLTLRGNFSSDYNVSGSKIRMVLRGDTSSYASGGDMIAVGLDSGRLFETSTSYFVSSDSVEIVQHVYDSRLLFRLDDSQPMGFQGGAFGGEVDLLNFYVTARGGINASNPREAYINSITFTVNGDADIADMALYESSDSFRSPIAVASVDHATAPTYNHRTTVFTLNLDGRSALVPFGSDKHYKLRGRVLAQVDANSPSRSVRVSIADYGAFDRVGDVAWYDNGSPSQYSTSNRATWIDDPCGATMLRPPLPISFGVNDPGFFMDSDPVVIPTCNAYDFFLGDISHLPEASIQLGSVSDLIADDDLEISLGNTMRLDESDDVELEKSFASSEQIDMYASSNPFADVFVDEIGGFAAVDLYLRDIISGYPDELFHGDYFVNRVETLKFLLTARYGKLSKISYDKRFADVDSFAWYIPYVAHGVEKKIVQGYSDGSFRPANPVLMAEFLKMLTLTFGLEENLPHTFTDVSSEDWFAPYAGVVEKYNLFPHIIEVLEPGKQLTRYEIAVAMFQMIGFSDGQ